MHIQDVQTGHIGDCVAATPGKRRMPGTPSLPWDCTSIMQGGIVGNCVYDGTTCNCNQSTLCSSFATSTSQRDKETIQMMYPEEGSYHLQIHQEPNSNNFSFEHSCGIPYKTCIDVYVPFGPYEQYFKTIELEGKSDPNEVHEIKLYYNPFFDMSHLKTFIFKIRMRNYKNDYCQYQELVGNNSGTSCGEAYTSCQGCE